MTDENHHQALGAFRETGPQPPEGATPGDQEKQPEPVPSIYVASLTDYSAGILHGAWIDAHHGPRFMRKRIDEMLAASPTTERYGDIAEEWRIDDYDSWGPHLVIHDFDSLTTISKLARGLTAHGPAFGAWIEATGERTDEVMDAFEDHYFGEYASAEDFGEHLLEGYGGALDELTHIPEGLRPYVQIDVAGWVRDMRLSGEITTVESTAGIYVFYTY